MSSPTFALTKPMLQEAAPRNGPGIGKIMVCAMLLGVVALFSLPYGQNGQEPLNLWASTQGLASRAAARMSPIAPNAVQPPLGNPLMKMNPNLRTPWKLSPSTARLVVPSAYGGPRQVIRADVEEKVKKMIEENLSVDADKIKPEASFIEDLGADSLDTVELLMAMEEEFGVEIPEEEAQKLTTVQAVIDYAKSKQ